MRRRSLLFLPLACCLLPLLTGCAKSPTGLTTNLAINRFQTVVSLAGTGKLNPNYYYAIAYDDTGTNSTGPVAVNGYTPIRNGVMGGTFRLLVLYHQNNFRVFYRPTPNSAASEQELLGATNLFNTGQAPRATDTGIDVTINLDAQFQSDPHKGTYVFPRAIGSTTSPPSIAANSLKINVAATNTNNLNLPPGSDNNLIKPVDALGNQTLSTPVEIRPLSPRTTSFPDAIGDENLGADPTYTTPGSPNFVPFQDIDITNVQIGIVRSQTTN